METINNLVTNYQQSRESNKLAGINTGTTYFEYSDSRQSERVLAKFWKRMVEMYGQLWAASYGASPTELWERVICALSYDEISRGLNACLDRESKYPPTLPEFKSLCKPKAEAKQACHVFFTRLPKPEIDREKAAGQLAAMRARLR